MENARFRPAQDEEGHNVAGSFVAAATLEAFETATDADSSKAVGPRPGKDIPFWATTADLPKGALKRGEIAISDLLVNISTTGRVAECRMPKPGNHPELDLLGCQLMVVRGNYQPALDASGQPVESIDWHRIRWQLPHN